MKNMCNYFPAYLALQLVEMNGHYERLSKELGYEPTKQYVLDDWINTGRAAEFRALYKQHYEDISKVCEVECGDILDCKGVKKCTLDTHLVHKTLFGE